MLCGQLVNYGHSSLTRGLEKSFPNQVITYPVSENLMNSSAMGLAMCGMRTIVLHERFDFAVVGMSPLVNEIPIYQGKLPIVFLIIVGHGKGQGPQQNKDFTHWFYSMYSVFEPHNPKAAYEQMKHALSLDSPSMVIIHRNLYD